LITKEGEKEMEGKGLGDKKSGRMREGGGKIEASIFCDLPL
jgi:hypothetical protein